MYINRLQELCEKDNVTFTSLCKCTNLDRSTIGKYINGYLIISLKHLNTICNYFSISLDYAFGLTNIKNYKSLKNDINQDLFIQRLKLFRKENKITQDMLAKELKCSHSAISEYEHGKRLISTSHLYSLCSKQNISADYLLGKTDKPKYLQ